MATHNPSITPKTPRTTQTLHDPQNKNHPMWKRHNTRSTRPEQTLSSCRCNTFTKTLLVPRATQKRRILIKSRWSILCMRGSVMFIKNSKRLKKSSKSRTFSCTLPMLDALTHRTCLFSLKTSYTALRSLILPKSMPEKPLRKTNHYTSRESKKTKRLFQCQIFWMNSYLNIVISSLKKSCLKFMRQLWSS